MTTHHKHKDQMTDKSDLDYYRTLPDYDVIKEYLDMTPVEVSLDDGNLPEFQPDFSNAILVDNVPKVGPEKIAKLLSVILKLYAQVSPSSPVTADEVYMPFDEATNATYGFCFIKFNSAEDAENAIKLTQGFALDKNHSFKVSAYADLDKFAKISESDAPPSLADFHAKPEVASWLTDEKGRDAFSVRYGKETEIYWANATGEEPSLIYGGEKEKKTGKSWCELAVEWSPQGTYFATFHKPGVKLWGGADFTAQGRFMHPSVEEISFSPCENYIITYRLTDQVNTNPNEAIIVWDVRTGEKIKTFSLKNALEAKFQVQATVLEDKAGKRVERVVRGRVRSYEGNSKAGYFTIEEGNLVHEQVPLDAVQALQDPNKLKWSADGQYVARLGADIISIYELPSMNLLEKKSIGAKDVLDFAWSPSSRANLFSYWSPAVGNHPALINIMRLPDRSSLSSRKLFDVSDVKMVWQNEGDFLCVHMVKNAGKKKSYVLMVFRVNVNGVPVEQIELNEPILNVSWEPSGDRILILYGDARNPTLSVYSMSTQQAPAASTKAAVVGKAPAAPVVKAELTQLFTKTGSQCNSVQWSPAGGVVALAYFAPDACLFELLDVDNNVTLATRRHDRCAKLQWDPSGRYVATCTITDLRNAHAKGNMDDGVNFYTFQGNLVCQMKREKLHSFAWRPRPRDLLSPEEKKKVVKNLRKYEKAFEKEDRALKDALTQELQANRYRIAKEFLEWMHANQARNAELKARRIALRSGYDSDDERNYDIDIVTA